MKVLIACECSGIVREAFLSLGHDAWSCDIKPSEIPTNRHIQDDLRYVIEWEQWDLAVMHPPCTRLCNSGVRWYTSPPDNPPSTCSPDEAELWPSLTKEEKLDMLWRHLDAGAEFFSMCWNADIPRICVENPVMHGYAKERIRNFEKQSQTVHPWQFGTDEDGPDNEKKRTCFWLRNLPLLKPTGTLDGSTARDSVHKASPGEQRATERSRFFPGIALAMAEQWGSLPLTGEPEIFFEAA